MKDGLIRRMSGRTPPWRVPARFACRPSWDMSRAGLAVFFVAAASVAAAQSPVPLHSWPEADLALGEKLIRQHDCSACHARKFGGDGSGIYRPQGRIGNPSALLTMVETCNTELNLGLFPEDVTAVAAVLQRDHYRFPRSTPPATGR